MKKQFGNGIDIPSGSIPTAIPTGGAKCGANSSTACTNPDAVILVGQSGFSSGATAQTSGTNAITILSPANGSTINKPRTIIKGTIDAASQDIGIVVEVKSGPNLTDIVTFPAHVNGRYFAAKIDLQEGTNAIKVIATDLNGTRTEATTTVNVSLAQQKVFLSAEPNSGVLILNARLGVTSYLQNQITKYAYDFNGDGTTDLECDNVIQITVNYQYPGLYLPTVTVTDSQGNTYTDTAIVNVLNKGDMDGSFKGIWDKMKARLKEGDVEGAVKYIVAAKQDKYRQIFTTMGDAVNPILAAITEIEAYAIEDGIAQYGAMRIENGVTYSYPLTFIQDENGIWKIKGF